MSDCLEKNKSVQKGFTLLELMLTIAIVGILATVSYGLYQQYIAKAKVSDLVFRIDAMRTAFSVLEASDGIPAFQSVTTGEVPPELSQLAITDDDLIYPELTLTLVKLGPIGKPSKPYLQVVGWGDKGGVEVKALSNDLAKGQFIWLVEPSVGLVPMLGSLTADDILYFNPSPASTGTPPIPTSSVTQVITPIVAPVANPVAVPIVSPWLSPGKLPGIKSSLMTLEKVLNGSALRLSDSSKLELTQYLQETLKQIDNGDPGAATSALSDFENGVDDLIQANRNNGPYASLLGSVLTDALLANSQIYSATIATPSP